MMYCCTEFAEQITHRCEKHSAFDCPDQVIIPTSYGYGLPIHDGGSSSIEIRFCPWCGQELNPTE